jgi:hypothetical protein
MTKHQRAKRLKAILAELLMPEPGRGTLYVEVRALTAHCLRVEVLKDKAPGEQVFVRVEVRRPNVVRGLFDQLTQGDKDVQGRQGEGSGGASPQ